MEENSEAHMETDVSSTTEDIPEAQEVTDSHGNVEMITVVVEQIKEEDIDEKTGKRQPCGNDCDPKNNDKSPHKVTSPESIPKLPIVHEPQHSFETPAEPAQFQKELNNSPLVNDNVEQPVVTKQTDVVDSSSKAESPNTEEVNKKNSDKSLVKTYEIKKNDQKSPIKEITLDENKQISSKDIITAKNNTNEKQTKAHITQDEVESNNIVIPVDITIERESSIDSNIETNSDTSEKEHNKSISRELKSLINSAKESKIISECTQVTTKMRKARTILDSSNTSLNSSIEPDKIQGVRRNSNNSQKSNCSEKSDKNVLKRSMRSQNPEFVSKVKQFLNSVTGKSQKDDYITDDDLEDKKSHDKEESGVQVSSSTPKKKKIEEIDTASAEKLQRDPYCWRCHWTVEQVNEKAHAPMLCTVCPRSFHFKCLSGAERNKIDPEKSWVCPDCLIILHAESSETRSPAMKKITLGMLCDLLKYALERMMDLNGVEPFMTPVDREAFPDYDKYVVHPMDLSLMKSNVAEGFYGSTEAFLADAQWILHNSIIFNTLQSKLTGGARALVRSCRAEMGEIEACPECYSAAHARRPTWFTDVCSTPHILLWAKLKGFPYWPAKGMSASSAGQVDVRFFGAHDRAWVPAKDCFLYSEKDPNNFRTKRQDLLDSMQEAEQHIRNISRKYGKFVYPPFRTQFEPSKLYEQLQMLIPAFEGEIRTHTKDKPSNLSPSLGKDMSRSNSKSSKGSVNDSDISEAEDPLMLSTNNVVDNGDLTTKVNETENKDKSMDVDIYQIQEPKDSTFTRKRRRSELEEAVITILDRVTTEKRKRVEEDKYTDCQEPSSSKDLQEEPKEDAKNTEVSQENDKKMKPAVEIQTVRDEEPSSSSGVKEKLVQIKEKSEKSHTTTANKITVQTKINKHVVKTNKDSLKSSTPNDKLHQASTPKVEKIIPQRQKPKRVKSLTERNKDETSKSERRRSKGNRSLSNNSGKSEKSTEKIEKSDESSNNKEKPKESSVKSKSTETDKSGNDKKNTASCSSMDSPKSVKDRLKFNDNTTLAVIARESTINVSSNISGLPTISSVRSLSSIAQSPNATEIKTTDGSKSIEVTIEADPDSSIFTPTTTDNIRNVKDAANKLQKLRNVNEPMVGRVGVRAFARMTSPERPTNDNMQVEIKAEPIDLDDPERHMEKMDLMKAFKLRPVNPSSSLREVRINKVVVTPLNRRAPTKPPEIRPRAKKTFPQPKKPEDSQLNGKNSMVYIPIQPPMTQAPVRFARPVSANGPVGNSILPRVPAPVTSPTANNVVNTVTTPLVPIITSMSAPPHTTTTPTVTATVQSIPTIGQVPTTVHTVPLMTSVNGQWMFSLQPVMSVGGGIDSTASSPTVNGLPERVQSAQPTQPALQLPLSATSNPANDVAAPGEPPRLQQRPALLNPLDDTTPMGIIPAPSTAGPFSAILNQNAVKLADFFRTLLQDSLEKLDDPASQVFSLRLQLEQSNWKHQHELDEMKHNHELVLAEIRKSFEKEKSRAVNEARRVSQIELEGAVKLSKSKQWCANCSQEAQFYCCWNTSYCDYPCQRAHWSQHFSVCTQQRAQDGSIFSKDGSSPPESRLQPQLDNLPKNSSAPALTVGGKLASRIIVQDQQNNGQKSSIIMSMMEDNSGNKTVKCVGTYSGTQKISAPAQVPPLILNKQVSVSSRLMLSDDVAEDRSTLSRNGVWLPSPAAGTHQQELRDRF